jgi:polyhydroxyalkanoate synthesis regulator phasin
MSWLAEENLTIVEDLLQEAKENNDGSDKGKAWVRSAQDKMNAAQSARAKGNDIYQKMLKKHSKDPESFHNKLETICQDLNIV